MQNKQLLDYIKQQIQQGVVIEGIRSALIRSGWNENDVNQAFTELKVEMPKETPVPPPQSNPVQANPIQSNSFTTQRANPKNNSRLIWELLILVILIAVGIVVYILKPDIITDLITNLKL